MPYAHALAAIDDGRPVNRIAVTMARFTSAQYVALKDILDHDGPEYAS